jgi:hypothetical protein
MTMTTRTVTVVRRGIKLAPALVLGATVVAAQNGYAAASGTPCFRPTLELCSQSSGASSTTEGDATFKATFKPPFILELAATADGYLDQDSGAAGALGAGATSKFWTSTCSGWSYSWSASGTVLGKMKAHTSSSRHGSALAVGSFSAMAAGDLNPAPNDSKSVQSSTSSGGSVTISVGMPSGQSYAIGMPLGTANVTPSTNAAGDANVLHKGPQKNVGPGPETVVVVNLYGYVSAQANGSIGSWAPHWQQSSASSGGHCGAAVEQGLFAVDANHVGYGMVVHVQSGFYRDYSKGGLNAPWKPSDLNPPIDPLGKPQGPTVLQSSTPAGQPDPNDRTPNNEVDRDPNDSPMHKY